MGITYNPWTKKLDFTWISSSSVQPQSGLASPEWSIAARYADDIFVNTATWVSYINPTAGANTGREIIQTAPAP